jgi:allantoicase
MGTSAPTSTSPAYEDLIDLAGERLGGAAIACNDDFFAEKENLVRAAPAVWKEHEYTERGKWMDGWETRRRRPPELGPDVYDWCIVRLGVPGIPRGVVVDTAFFRGNYPASAALEACFAPQHASPDELQRAEWVEILPRSPLAGDSKNRFDVNREIYASHVRLRIYPDGGVARLRVYGEVLPDLARLGGLGGELDLAAVENGGYAMGCSDMFFGVRHNLLMPGRAQNMSDGWETRRRRGPGHDWVIVRLVGEGVVRRLELDTNWFKGNAPGAALVEGCHAPGATLEELTAPGVAWRPLLAETAMQPHARHFFEALPAGEITHARLSVFPDGGVSRMRLYGALTDEGRRACGLRRLDALPESVARRELQRCCAARRWVDAVVAGRPYVSVTALRARAEEAFAALGPADWHEAFAAHPRIGESQAARAQSAAEARWSSGEQAGARSADAAARAALIDVNREYEARFGHIYIVCATGKSAEDLLALARARLANDAATELRVAAGELEKIMQLRLDKLLRGV